MEAYIVTSIGEGYTELFLDVLHADTENSAQKQVETARQYATVVHVETLKDYVKNARRLKVMTPQEIEKRWCDTLLSIRGA